MSAHDESAVWGRRFSDTCFNGGSISERDDSPDRRCVRLHRTVPHPSSVVRVPAMVPAEPNRPPPAAPAPGAAGVRGRAVRKKTIRGHQGGIVGQSQRGRRSLGQMLVKSCQILSNLVKCLSNLPARRLGSPVKAVKPCQTLSNPSNPSNRGNGHASCFLGLKNRY